MVSVVGSVHSRKSLALEVFVGIAKSRHEQASPSFLFERLEEMVRRQPTHVVAPESPQLLAIGPSVEVIHVVEDEVGTA